MNISRIALCGLAFAAACAAGGQSLQSRERVFITGTDGPDTLTVNDAAGVICASRGVTIQGAGEARVLAAADSACPLSSAGHNRWTVQNAGDNYYSGDFRAGADRYTRIDGPGNDRFEYYAGDGDDMIFSTDGPGNDVYIYNNGPGNDLSAHDSGGRIAGGNDLYNIDGGPGIDRLEVTADGPGDDVYNFLNGETRCFTDTHFGDTDRFMSDEAFSRRLPRGLPAPTSPR